MWSSFYKILGNIEGILTLVPLALSLVSIWQLPLCQCNSDTCGCGCYIYIWNTRIIFLRLKFYFSPYSFKILFWSFNLAIYYTISIKHNFAWFLLLFLSWTSDLNDYLSLIHILINKLTPWEKNFFIERKLNHKFNYNLWLIWKEKKILLLSANPLIIICIWEITIEPKHI